MPGRFSCSKFKRCADILEGQLRVLGDDSLRSDPLGNKTDNCRSREAGTPDKGHTAHHPMIRNDVIRVHAVDVTPPPSHQQMRPWGCVSDL